MTELNIITSTLLAAYALILFTPDQLQGGTKWWGMNLLMTLLCLFAGSSIIRMSGYLISSTLALRRDEPPRKNIYRMGKPLSYFRAAIGYMMHLVLALVIVYKLCFQWIPVLLKLYAAGNFYAWSITITLATITGLFILWIVIEEKRPKMATWLKWIMICLLILLISVGIAACVA